MKTQTRTQKSKQTPQITTEPKLSAARGKRQRIPQQAGIDAHTRHRMIAEAAYYLAAKRGFQGGSAQQDWLNAEEQIDAQLVR